MDNIKTIITLEYPVDKDGEVMRIVRTMAKELRKRGIPINQGDVISSGVPELIQPLIDKEPKDEAEISEPSIQRPRSERMLKGFKD